MTGYLGDQKWTVTVTLRVWPDNEQSSPIVDEIEHALRPILGRDETMLIDVHEPEPVASERTRGS